MLGVLTMVLLAIACGNVANLVMGAQARAPGRSVYDWPWARAGERLLRQLMTESLVLALAGGVAGTVIAGAGVALLKTFAPSSGLDVPTPLTIRLDGRSVVLTFLIAAGSAVFFGLGPALRAGRTDLLSTLKPGAAEGGRERMIWRSTLVVVQIAGSLVLLVAATQLARGMSLPAAPESRVQHRPSNHDEAGPFAGGLFAGANRAVLSSADRSCSGPPRCAHGWSDGHPADDSRASRLLPWRLKGSRWRPGRKV